MRRLVIGSLILNFCVWLGVGLHAQDIVSKSNKFALLIGVNKYSDLTSLDYAANDQWALAQRLKMAGFPDDQVFVLASQTSSGENNADVKSLPMQRNILKWLSNVVDLTRKGDLLVVAFSGHGIQIGEHNYLCPIDADPADPEGTMINVALLNAKLKVSDAALKLLVLDACRDDPRPPGTRSAIGDVRFEYGLPPDGVVSIRSCSRGKIAREDQELGHGVFMHFFLQGLDGKAAGDDGTVTLGRLFDYASRQTDKYVVDKFGDVQRPVMIPERVEEVALVRSTDRHPLVPAELLSGQVRTNSIGMKLVLVPAGEFLMGSEETRVDIEKAFKLDYRYNNEGQYPQHRVRITKPFELGVFEVTKGQYARFVAATSYKTEAETDDKGGEGWNESKWEYEDSPEYTWRNTGFDQTDDHPVVNVSWNDAMEFCRWLSKQEDRTYRLPTEAEWEYACRAGTTSRFSNGDDPAGLAAIGNCNSRKDGFFFTAPAGHYRRNAFGLYDMHGNVWEWCADWSDESYYANSPVDDPPGLSSGEHRAIRSGGWRTTPSACRSAHRFRFLPSLRYIDLGFRVVSVPSE